MKRTKDNSRQKPLPHIIQQPPKPLRLDRVLQIQAIAVELGDAACGRDDAGRVPEFDDVEGFEEGFADGGCEPVVWGGCEG